MTDELLSHALNSGAADYLNNLASSTNRI